MSDDLTGQNLPLPSPPAAPTMPAPTPAAPAAAPPDPAQAAAAPAAGPRPIRMMDAVCVDVVRRTHDAATLYFFVGEHGGYKEVVARISGQGVYPRLKFESGAHRVQRVPETESQGRIHTSACTVAVLPEADEVEDIDINPADLRVDTFRASGAGGQHVNKTDSAVRLTHLPSGVVVECQDERSQHKNKARAMSLLASRLKASAEAEAQQSEAADRRLQVGSGDRSERIRTYNFPQNRLTDHRINLTLYKLDEVMMGSLEQVVEPLMHEYQAEQLASLSADA